MTQHITGVGLLGPDRVRSALRAALLAPSTHNTQPWLFRCTADGIEVRADSRRALSAADPDGRELVLSCGAALLNLRVAIQAQGVHPTTTLLPRRDDPGLLAVVRPFTPRAANPRIARLAEAIPRRHTNRRPFTGAAVGTAVLTELRAAAEIEHTWLPRLDSGQRKALHDLVQAAHEAQLSDPAFLAEWQEWTGRANDAHDGVPAYAAGVSPAVNDSWVLRDFAPGDGDSPAREIQAGDPMVLVIGSFRDDRLDHLRAGQAMERLLLTATAAGLDASFISQPVEVPAVRAELRQLLGGGLWPQIVLRVGYGTPAPKTPRRSLDEVLVSGGSIRTGQA